MNRTATSAHRELRSQLSGHFGMQPNIAINELVWWISNEKSVSRARGTYEKRTVLPAHDRQK
jgi:hypothetical protein